MPNRLPLFGVLAGLAAAIAAPRGEAAALHAPPTPAASSVAPATYDGCIDHLGRPVLSIRDDTVSTIAVAKVENGAPVIRYNGTVLSYFAPESRLFWYAHECAHHALGHAMRNNPLSREKEADCWAVRELVDAGLINRSDLRIIMDDISMLPGDGWVYLPGPQRALLLGACGSAADDDDDTCVETRVECQHAAHRADVVPCSHPAHRADVVPCQHICFSPYYGAVACHQGDTVPCTHALHEADTVPCTHVAHPGGHRECI